MGKSYCCSVGLHFGRCRGEVEHWVGYWSDDPVDVLICSKCNKEKAIITRPDERPKKPHWVNFKPLESKAMIGINGGTREEEFIHAWRTGKSTSSVKVYKRLDCGCFQRGSDFVRDIRCVKHRYFSADKVMVAGSST